MENVIYIQEIRNAWENNFYKLTESQNGKHFLCDSFTPKHFPSCF